MNNVINSNLNFRSMDWGNSPKMIVLHHAEASNCSVEDIHNWHRNNGWAGIGYHYFVRKNGQIYKGRPDDAIGAHVAGHNTHTLGVCAEGAYMSETMPVTQKNSIIELCQYLCKKYNISKVYGHREVGESDCPGSKYPLSEIKNAVSKGGNVSVPGTNTSANSNGNGGSYYDVKEVQNMLIKIGYPCGSYGADGAWGDGTLTAVKAFQKDCNLVVDGWVGDTTYSKIKAEYNKKVSTSNNNNINLDGKTGTIDTPSGVNVRAGKSTGASVLGVLPNGSKVQLYRKEGEWMHIYYPPHGGYIYAKYVRV